MHGIIEREKSKKRRFSIMTTNLAIVNNSYRIINRRQQKKADKLIYTRKAASRLLKVEYEAIEFVYVADNFVLVGLYNTSVKLDKAEFTTLFVNDRKARSKSLTVTKKVNSSINYTVRNEDNGHRYSLKLYPDSVHCQCADYQKQIEAIGKGCCKHSYALLNQLGYNSLENYIKAMDNLRAKLCSTSLRGLYPKYDSYDVIKAEARM